MRSGWHSPRLARTTRPDRLAGVALDPGWMIPDWPAPVGAVCTTRAGGVSRPPYDSLNLGDHVRDDPAAVRTNRCILRDAIGARPVFLQQVHGTQSVLLDEDTPDGVAADACVTGQPGVACAVMVADCLPVLFSNTQGTVVAAAHAGWRGLAGESGHGVLESIVTAFRQLAAVGSTKAGARMDDILVWLGPCIGQQAFEVGAEVRAAFCSADPLADMHFRSHGQGKYLADLAGLARQRLSALGIKRIFGNDSSPAWCTVGNPSRFFSHRRDAMARGSSGRLAACVWIDNARRLTRDPR
jgi:polyphenol oxidase